MPTSNPYTRFLCEPMGPDVLAEELAFRCGAAVAFGLMGMAEAIRNRPKPWTCVDCGDEVVGRDWCPECEFPQDDAIKLGA